MKIYGQLEQASLEQLSSDPAANTQGRIYSNTTTGQIKTDDGVNKRALLRNDEKAIIGNDASAANNVRLHRAGASLLQFVLASDATVDGSLGASIAKLSARIENYTTGTLPTPGQTGRIIYLTDIDAFAVDNGAGFTYHLAQSLATTKGDILARSSSALTRLAIGSNNQVLTADSSQTLGMKWATPSAIPTIANTTGSYTSSIGDGTRFFDTSGGVITITLPAAAGHDGEKLVFQKTSNDYTAATLTAVTTLNTQNERVTIQSNGSAWTVIDRYIPSAWAAATFGFSGGITAVGGQDSYARRVGDSFHGRIAFANMTVAAAVASITLPSGIAIDTTKFSTTRSVVGSYVRMAQNGLFYGPTAANGNGGVVFLDSSLTTSLRLSFQCVNTANPVFSTFTMNSFFTSTDGLGMEFTVPIATWNG